MKYRTILPLIVLLLIIFSAQKTEANKKFHKCKHDEIQSNLSKKGIQRQSVEDILKNTNNQNNNNYNSNDIKNKHRKLSTNNILGETPQPIRIHPVYLLDGMTSQYQQIIKDAVEISIKYFQDVFQVYPLKQTLKIIEQATILNGAEGLCKDLESQQNIFLPDMYYNTGVENTDLIIFVNYEDEPNDDFLAYALSCQWQDDRPTIGVITYNLAYFKSDHFTVGSGASFEFHLETTIHELFHVMGFNGAQIPYFRNKQKQRQADQTFLKTKTIRGKPTLVLATPEVKKHSQTYFGCSDIEGAQLENDGGEASQGSHWERLIFYNEVMNPSGIQSDSVTSLFTLAFFQDTNWYADVNTDLAENMQWGKGRGCDFLDSCDSSFPEFTTPNDDQLCTFYRFGIGHSAAESFTDDCPIGIIYSDTDCTNPAHKNTNNAQRTFEEYSASSKCFDSDFIENGFTLGIEHRCYENQCLSNGNVEIKLKSSSQTYTLTCTQNGQVLQPPQGSNLQGTLTCPENLAEFCQFPVPCENYCSQKGYCLRRNGQNQCRCIDGYGGSDCSISCPSNYISSSGSCIQQCGNQEYRDPVTKQCNACDSSCSENCNGPTANDCQSCQQGQYAKDGSCVTDCGDGFFANENSGLCEQCSSDCTQCIRKSDNCLVKPVIYADVNDLTNQLKKQQSKNNSHSSYLQAQFLLIILLITIIYH